MKGYYITYGIFSKDLEKIVEDLTSELKITLVKDDTPDLSDELYYLKPNSTNFITNFSILNTTENYQSGEILTPLYLISCNITSEEDEKKKELYVQDLRNRLNKKEYLKELNVEIDEW